MPPAPCQTGRAPASPWSTNTFLSWEIPAGPALSNRRTYFQGIDFCSLKHKTTTWLTFARKSLKGPRSIEDENLGLSFVAAFPFLVMSFQLYWRSRDMTVPIWIAFHYFPVTALGQALDRLCLDGLKSAPQTGATKALHGQWKSLFRPESGTLNWNGLDSTNKVT